VADYDTIEETPIECDDSGFLTHAKFGDGTNYAEFESTGFFKATGGARYYDDLNFIALNLKPGATAPGSVNIAATSIPLPTWAGTGVAVTSASGGSEIKHSYAEGTDLVPHVHWTPTDTSVGNVKWNLEYWIRRGSLTITTGTATGTAAATGAAWGWDEIRTDLTTISGADITIGCQIGFRLWRDPADVADTYEAPAGVFTVGFHAIHDTLGSRTITAK
jgi:hypothetical protein